MIGNHIEYVRYLLFFKIPKQKVVISFQFQKPEKKVFHKINYCIKYQKTTRYSILLNFLVLILLHSFHHFFDQ